MLNRLPHGWVAGLSILVPVVLLAAALQGLGESERQRSVGADLARIETLTSWLLVEGHESERSDEVQPRSAVSSESPLVVELDQLVSSASGALPGDDAARLRSAWHRDVRPAAQPPGDPQGASTQHGSPGLAHELERRMNRLHDTAGRLGEAAHGRASVAASRSAWAAGLAMLVLAAGSLGLMRALADRKRQLHRLVSLAAGHRSPSARGAGAGGGNVDLKDAVEEIAQRLDSTERATRSFEELGGSLTLTLALDGTLLDLGEGWATLMGRQPAELRGKNWLALVHPDDYDSAAAAFGKLVSGAGFRAAFQCRCVADDGSPRSTSWGGLVDRDAGTVYLLGHDTSSQSAIAAAMEARAHAGWQLLDEAPAAACVVQEGFVVYANRALARAAGFDDPAPLLGAPVSALVAPGTPDPAADMLRVLEAGPDGMELGELPMLRPDGTLLSFSVIAKAVSFQGSPAVMCVGQDVTAHRRQRAQTAIAERIGSVGLLAAGLAHEVNNPLSYLLDSLRVLTERLADDPDGALLVADAADASQSIARVVASLDAFAGVDHGSEMGPCSVVEALQSAAAAASGSVHNRAQLKQSYDSFPAVLAPAGALAQLFLNLIVNAAQAIPEGERASHTIALRCSSDGDHVVVEVRDDGVGIDEADISRLFDPFFTTRSVGEGAGLGLAVCRGIVDRCGGRMEVDSLRGFGTTVRVLLPFAPGAEEGLSSHDQAPLAAVTPAATAPEPPPAEPTPIAIPPSEAAADASAGPRVLVVDDDERVARAVARSLRRRYTVDVVHSATCARASLAGARYDAIVCDLMMPDGTGNELHAWMEAHHPRLADRMLLVTGGALTPETRRFLARGVVPCLLKPIDPEQLHGALDTLLAGPSHA